MEAVISHLRRSSLFAGLDLNDLELLSDRFQSCRFQAGEVIFGEGEAADCMYLLAQGAAVVLKRMGSGQRELRRLAAGDCFGELALISREPRYATVQAESDSVCLKIHEADFADLLRSNAHFERGVLELLSGRLKYSEDAASASLLKSYQTMIFALADLAESRDPETGAHLNRVREYCRLLAQLVADRPAYSTLITVPFIDGVYHSSPLHDIGKVGIPDNILLKPGRLTVEEFRIMQRHTVIGAETVHKVVQSCSHPFFLLAYNLVHYHHERFDGSGYPTGLAGEAIPLEARIMALADVYDALLSKRSYKEAFSYQRSAGIIEEGAGSHFDPVLARLMLDNIHRFEAIHKSNSD